MPAPPKPAPEGWLAPELLAYEPELVPPLALRRTEGIEVIEEWFRRAEEWSVVLRAYGGLGRDTAVLEIGCGLGRIAFPLRYVLGPEGRYEGFEIVREKVDFLQREFTPRHPRFRFTWADVHNAYYNPAGPAREPVRLPLPRRFVRPRVRRLGVHPHARPGGRPVRGRDGARPSPRRSRGALPLPPRPL